MAKRDAAIKAENEAKAEANQTKRTRTVLTPAQRIEKAKAELAALEAKVNEKEEKARAAARVKRDALVAKRNALNVQIQALDDTIGDAADIDEPTPIDDES